MSSQTVFKVSGATRGIGYSLVELLSKRDDVIIYAGARDLSKSEQLQKLVESSSGKVRVIKLISADVEGNRAAASQIEKEVGRLDVVIANAAILGASGSVETVSPEGLNETFEVNTVGPLVLFQSTIDLLRRSKKAPKFVVVSTLAGSIALLPYGMAAFPIAAYSASKFALNALFTRAHFEHEKDKLVTFVLHPGTLETDAGKAAIAAWGTDAIKPDDYDESIGKIVAVVDRAEREKDGGKFINAINGEEVLW